MKYPYALLAGLLGTLVLALPAVAAEKTVVGWIEKVRLYPGNFLVHAKLDSGAEYSSLDASNLQEFERDGKKWVRFDLAEDREGNKITIERPLLRWAPIKRHNQEPQRRPVIKLGVCLGNIYKETEVNLIDRKNYQYRMLIGRKFMEGSAIIDPSAKYTAEPNCKKSTNLE
ncbi:MAG: ATP-dependent zinc protease family protein [Desulfobaccales bacterium]